MPAKTASRSATGDKLGKSALRAILKNAEAVTEYLDALKAAKDLDDIDQIGSRDGLTLARVTRALGAGRLEVTLLDGRKGVPVPIGGSIKFKGRAGTKTDRSNCMCVNDVVVIRGAFASGKLPGAAIGLCADKFEKLGQRIPAGFFAAPGVEPEADSADETYEFDYTERNAKESAKLESYKTMASSAAVSASATTNAAGNDSDLDIDAI